MVDLRAHSALHFRLGLAVSREDPFSTDLSRGFSRVVDMAVVGFVGMLDLDQVLLVAAVAVIVQAIVILDQLTVLVRHVGESTRDSVI